MNLISKRIVATLLKKRRSLALSGLNLAEITIFVIMKHIVAVIAAAVALMLACPAALAQSEEPKNEQTQSVMPPYTLGYPDRALVPSITKAYANEISVSYGPLSNSDLSGLIVTALVNLFDKNAHAKVSGAISGEYYRRLGHLVSVGGSFSLYNMSGNNSEGVTSNYTNYILMAGARLRWYNRGWFASYSKFAAGVKYCDWGKDARNFTPAFQVSLLGLEAGPRFVRVFTEIGVGDQGLALAGIRCCF